MVLDAWEQDPHGVGAVVQEGDAGAVQLLGELVDVRLQLSKGCGGRGAPAQRELDPVVYTLFTC